MHFHFFVIVAVITLYQSWLPFGVAIGFVALHHTAVGFTDPLSVFNHPAAVEAPLKWALIHAGFILGESAACLTAWRLNESALAGERAARVALEQANEDLAQAQHLARVGSWDWNVRHFPGLRGGGQPRRRRGSHRACHRWHRRR
jgi:hypothetical protein